VLGELITAWVRPLVAAAIALASVGMLAWAIARDTPDRDRRPAPALAEPAPEIPRRLESPRASAAAPPEDSTFAAALERGIAAYNADDVDAAADAFEEAVRLAPEEPEAHINLGLVYMRLQRPEDGLRELAAGARLEDARGAHHRRETPADARSNGTIDVDEPASFDDRR
jgi:tetratricopeptide (TPR) repeat protein